MIVNNNLINTVLRYIIFFICIYILTCFLDKKLVYYYLFLIFILSIIIKLGFYSSQKSLLKLAWAFIALCIICLFAGQIKIENQSYGFIFDTIISTLSTIGSIIKSIFLESKYIYIFLFMVLFTLYSSLISKGNANYGIIGWVLGVSTGFILYIFISN